MPNCDFASSPVHFLLLSFPKWDLEATWSFVKYSPKCKWKRYTFVAQKHWLVFLQLDITVSANDIYRSFSQSVCPVICQANMVCGSGATLILSWRRSLSYRNQSIDLQSKSMDSFRYDRDLRHEMVKQILKLSFWNFTNKYRADLTFTMNLFKFMIVLHCFLCWSFFKKN